MRPVITLLTDFGFRDSYVAEMKGVILEICPEAVLVDITHEIEKFNVLMGAFTLASAIKFFQRGSIHLAVVDPGVGGARKPIIVETDRGYLVGPDNGLLSLSADKKSVKRVYEIKSCRYTRREISATFHGRDIFAPAAAYLAKGVHPKRMGFEVKGYMKISFVKPVIRKGFVECEVLHVDSFGNVIINLSCGDLDEAEVSATSKFDVTAHNRTFEASKASTYSEADEGSLVVVPYGSHGFIELSVNKGSAAQLLEVVAGSRLALKFRS